MTPWWFYVVLISPLDALVVWTVVRAVRTWRGDIEQLYGPVDPSRPVEVTHREADFMTSAGGGRAIPSALVATTAVFVAMNSVVIARGLEWEPSPALLTAAQYALGIPLGAGVLGAFTTVFFARPRWAIFPHLRAGLEARDAMRRRRRARRSRA